MQLHTTLRNTESAALCTVSTKKKKTLKKWTLQLNQNKRKQSIKVVTSFENSC